MNSLILRHGSNLLSALLLVFSLFLLIRGHNFPGGGFSGGLVAAAAFVLQAFARGLDAASRTLAVDPRSLIGLGLLTALFSGMIAWLWGNPYLTGHWLKETVPVLGKAGTPLLFDFGVYLVVLGICCLITFTMAEPPSDQDPTLKESQDEDCDKNEELSS